MSASFKSNDMTSHPYSLQIAPTDPVQLNNSKTLIILYYILDFILKWYNMNRPPFEPV